MSKSDAHLEETRRQVDEVQNIMKGNVEKMLERDGKLGQLEERADRLQEGTEQFHRSAVRIKRKQFWQNMKMKIIICVVIFVVLVIIIALLFS
uniref:V-SNARE coiled-coil homology domain-containing protein n=1 Tax=Lepeophtheirus salmonis TaxID=72036 RepID=A0A0K2UMA9_LEPSM|nr:synaptobrevin-1-like [Lepeophtheirus salmonis]